MQQFLHDHPELLPRDGTVDMTDFFNRNRALEASVAREIDPLLDEFDEQLARQQQAVRTLSFLSPAIVVQEALADLSGGSTERFARFKAEAWKFVEEKKSYFFQKVFRNERLRSEDFARFPVFRREAEPSPTSGGALAILTVASLLSAIALGSRLSKVTPIE